SMNRKGKIILFILRNGVLRFIGASILSFLLVSPVLAQSNTGKGNGVLSRSGALLDSLAHPADSLREDSLSQVERRGLRLSPDAMESVVESSARDSAVLDMEGDQFYLYGEGEVRYQDLNLKAGKILFLQKEN